jgi:hypothetical protein
MKTLNETEKTIQKIKLLLKEDGIVLNKFFTKQLTEIIAEYGNEKYKMGYSDKSVENNTFSAFEG